MRYLGRVYLPLVVIALALVLVSTATAAQQRGRQGMRGHHGGQSMSSVPGLRQYPLSTDQQNEIARIRTEGHRQMQQVRQDTSLSAQQRADRMRDIHQQTHQQVMNVLTEQQRQELSNWWSTRSQMPHGGRGAGPGMGMGAGSMKGTMPGLTQSPLSDAQKQRILSIRSSYRQQIMDARRNTSMSSQQRMDRINQLRQQQHQEIMNVLTPAQRQEFDNWWSSRQQSGAGAGPCPNNH